MWTKEFWKSIAERALSTAAEALLASLGMSAVAIQTIDWPTVLGVAAMAAVLSVLKNAAVTPPEVVLYQAQHTRKEG
jgi:hypothetical protein